MNVLMGNPLVKVSNGTDQSVLVPSTALPEYEFASPISASGSGITLPSLQSFAQPSATPSQSSNQVTPGDVLGAAVAVAQAAAGVASGGAIGGATGSLASSSVVTIVLGILFIAAGIFSFRGPRETVIKAAKTAAVAA